MMIIVIFHFFNTLFYFNDLNFKTFKHTEDIIYKLICFYIAHLGY